MNLSPELLQRSPLITENAAALLQRMLSHPDAPNWNYSCGDRIEQHDLEQLELFRDRLHRLREPWLKKTPPAWLLQRCVDWSIHVPLLRLRISPTFNFDKQWEQLPTTCRHDLATSLLDMIPADAEVSRMVTHVTSGTTGHALLIPHHPLAGSCYLPLLDLVLSRYGVSLSLNDEVVGCFLLCAQQKTIMYATPHAAWKNSGFAKINLAAHVWPTPDSLARYCQAFQPEVLSGDPISFAEMLRQRLPLRPKAMISTAITLNQELKQQLEDTYQCPVIDWYSSNETGPLAYQCRESFFHLLPHDVFVELLDADGAQVPDGQRGEITVSGGRNPYLPMLRYRIGDFARLLREPCACHDPMPRLLDLEGRAPVLLYAASGAIVNTVDVSRILRRHPIVQHQLIQHRDQKLTLRLHATQQTFQAQLTDELRELFGPLPINLSFVEAFDSVSGKILPYQRES
jgi:phenylacetate-CoA ligase